MVQLEQGTEYQLFCLVCPDCNNKEYLDPDTDAYYETFELLHCSPKGVVRSWKCLKCGKVFYTELE